MNEAEFAKQMTEAEAERKKRIAKLKELPPMPGKTKAEREYNLAIHGMSDKLEAVRKAIAAYAEALEAIKQAAPHVPGTCVMSRTNSLGMGYYTCSECDGNGSARDKFCAHCGAEIIRFDDLNQSRAANLDIINSK